MPGGLMLGSLLIVFISAAGFVYYLVFGSRTLEPSIHTGLTPTRLVELFREVFSYGADGATFVLSDETRRRLLEFRKDIRGQNDVHIVWTSAVGVSRDDAHDLAERVSGRAIAASGSVGANFDIDLDSSAELAAALAIQALQHFFHRDLESGVQFHATGVTLVARNGWRADG